MYITKLIILFWMLGGTLYSQVSFYLRPTVNMKTNQGRIWGPGAAKPIYSTMTNQYFSIISDRSYFDNGNINLGLHLGIKVRDKHFFELGASTDNAGIKTQAFKHDWSLDPYTSNPNPQVVRKGGNNNQYIHGSPFTRISFSYNNLIWKNTAETVRLRGIVGFGSMFNPYVNRKKGEFVSQVNNVFEIGIVDSNAVNDVYEITSTSAWRNSLYGNIGLGADFYSKKKKSYLFSFDLFFLQGTRNVQIAHHRININDNGKDINFFYTFSSRGSGFYFTLSRRLQVYPWRPNKNKNL